MRRRKQRATVESGTSFVSRMLKNPYGKLTILSASDIDLLHKKSLEILSRTGVVFNNEEAIFWFRKAGVKIQEKRVYLEEEHIDEALSQTPSIYTLKASDSRKDVPIGKDYIAVMSAGGPAFIFDLNRKRRPGTHKDLVDLVKLMQMQDRINVIGRKVVDATDLSPTTRHLDCWRTCLTFSDKPIQSGFVGGQAEAEDVLQMLAIVFGGEDNVQDIPRAQTNVNVNSPLFYDEAMLEALITFSKWGQPVQISPFVMAGISGSATMAGSLVQHNAEVLAGIVLTQLINPGTPVLYGSATSNVDLKTGAPATASPESASSVTALAQLARHYGLPSRAGGALSDSPIPDQQAAFERMMSLMTSVFSGVNFIMHGAGVIESYLTVSPAQFIMDVEMLEMLSKFLEPIEISEDTVPLDVIDEVGPGGIFLSTAHTLERFRNVHFLPEIAIRRGFEQWEADGSIDILTRAEDRCRQVLESYVAPEFSSDIIGQLDNFVEKRTSELS